ncbi:aspartic peptidase domain-containing protein [Zopfochytrium polystomum]|nr:aspartic peptidase domain-containing protein [Zopfochytrium polystomum]
MWLLSSKCASRACRAAPTTYDPAASATYCDPRADAPTSSYADGTRVAGRLAVDTVGVADVAVPRFRFTEATAYDTAAGAGANDADGIVGLSLPVTTGNRGGDGESVDGSVDGSVDERGDSHRAPPLLVAMAAQRVVPAARFGYYVAPDGRSGAATFGGFDRSLFADTVEGSSSSSGGACGGGASSTGKNCSGEGLEWFPVFGSDGDPAGREALALGRWGVRVTAVSVGSKTYRSPVEAGGAGDSGGGGTALPADDSGTGDDGRGGDEKAGARGDAEPLVALMDTGTSLGLLPPAVLDALAAAVPGNSAQRARIGRGQADYIYTLPCLQQQQQEQQQQQQQQQRRRQPSVYPLFTLHMPTGGALHLTASEYVVDIGNNTCIIGFLAAAAGGKGLPRGTLLLGNTFLKRFYTVFDADRRRIGFALAKGRSAVDAGDGGGGGGAGEGGTRGGGEGEPRGTQSSSRATAPRKGLTSGWSCCVSAPLFLEARWLVS